MRKGSILIVEDDPVEQMLIKKAFEQIGVKDTIYAVGDGQDAIAFLTRKGEYADYRKFLFPTILLVDLKMPKVHGFELLLFLKRSKLIIIPTIIFTMSSDPDDIKHAYLLGANAYHVKPHKMEGLCDQLRKIYEYWTDVELPKTDEWGNLLPTQNSGKPGGKLSHPVTFDI